MPKKSQNFLQKIREAIWNYPSLLFSKNGLILNLILFYKRLMPFSHMVVFVLVLIAIGTANFSGAFAFIRVQQKELIEGVIIGDSGLSRINPLFPTNNQIETDLAHLIYEPLVRVSPEDEVRGVLASSWEADANGKNYTFHLREDVYWHDGDRLTADDVIATFGTLKELGASGDSDFSGSKYAQVAQTTTVQKTGNFTLIFTLSELDPTFYEDISWGIMPKSILDNVNLSTFSWASFNMKPDGTGPFVFISYKDNEVTLTANQNYYMGAPKIETLKIVLFKTGDDAVYALKAGKIHMLDEPSTAILEDIEKWGKFETIRSAVIYRRYWALYFNLKEGGPEVFKDKKVRQAISSAINREILLENVETAGEEAMGPIPVNSWAYNKDAVRYTYDFSLAEKLLDEAGWKKQVVEGKAVRVKGEEILRFELSYLDKYDRQTTAESIKSDLADLGIVVNLDPRSSSDLNEALIAPRNFEAVLYGVETPVDPDRVRLWHSKAIDYPGLNISSYTSQEQGAIIGEEKKLERISLTDATLESARATLDRAERNGTGGASIGYLKFQSVLLEDAPVVFLYHPVFVYVVHSRVKGIDLSLMTAPEDRYLSVINWTIE